MHIPEEPDPMATPSRAVSNWNVANQLTALRILLVPVFAVLLLTDGGSNTGFRWAAFAVFVLASLTDRIDGDLARSRDLVTDLTRWPEVVAAAGEDLEPHQVAADHGVERLREIQGLQQP